MKRLFLVLLVVVLYALHQDVWFWRTTHPLLLGFLPIGITYHVGFTLAVTALMGLLVKMAWPAHLESGGEGEKGEKGKQETLPVSPFPSLSFSDKEDAAP